MRTSTAALALALAAVPPAAAQTWTGVADGNWNNSINWDPAGVPASSSDTQLTFDATTHPSMNNDVFGSFFRLNRLIFTSAAPAYSLTGTALDFRTTSGLVPLRPSIVMDTNSAVTVGQSTVLTNNLTVSGAGAGNLTFNGALSGTGSLSYAGAGTLTLGAPNNYSGGTFVNSGTLSLAGSPFARLPLGGNVTVGNGSGPAVLNVNNVSHGSASTAIGTLTLNTGGTFHAPGGLGGDFYLNQLVMAGGTVDLSASPNYWLHFANAGAGITINPGASTWIAGGTSRLQNDTAAPLPITVSPGATLNAGVILSNAGSNPNFSFVSPDGSGVVVLTNPGNTANMTFNNINLYTNDLSTNAGGGAFGTLGTGAVTINGRQLVYTGPTAVSAKPMTFAGFNNGIWLPNPGTTLTLAGVLGGNVLEVAGPFSGAATLALTADNTFTGSVQVYGGATVAVPRLGNAGAGGVASPLGASSNAAVNLQLGGAGGRGDLLVTGTVTFYATDRGVTLLGLYAAGGGGGIGVLNPNRSLSWNGPITSPAGTGTLIKTGAGELILNNPGNNYAGGTVIEAGNLRLGVAGAIPAGGPMTVLGGSLSLVDGFNLSVGSLAGAAGATVRTFGATLTAGTDNTSATFAGNILDGQLTKVGAGVLTLTGLGNTANLVTVGTGAIAVSDMAALGTGIVALQGAGDNGGGLLYTGPTATSAKNITLAASSTIQVATPGTNLTLTGVIGEPVGSPGQALLVTGTFVTGTPGTLTLAGTNTYTGQTEIVGNAVVAVPTITNAGVPGPLGAGPGGPGSLLLNGGGLVLTGTDAAYGTDRGVNLTGACTIGVQNAGTTLTISGAITGPGIFHKVGAGTLVLANGTNNYAGGTFIDAGRLALGANNVTPNLGNITVAAGATFDTAGFDNYFTPAGTVTLNGGTLRLTSGFYMSQFVVGAAGGTVDMTGAGPYFIAVTGAGGVVVNGNSTWAGGAVSGVADLNPGSTPIVIAPNATVTSNVSLSSGSGFNVPEFRLTGGGTLYLTNAAVYSASVRVSQGRLRMDDLATVTAAPAIGFDLALDGGTLQYGGPTASAATFGLTDAGGTVEILNPAATLTLTGAIAGTYLSPLTKSGPGTLALANPANTFGPLTVAAGRLDVPVDAALGQGPITVGPFGTVRYTASATTARTFTLNAGALEAAAGVTLTLDGAAVGGGFLRGAGTFAVTGGTTLAGVTTASSSTVTVAGPASFANFANGGALAVTGGPVTFSLVTNQGSGSVTVGAATGAGTTVTAADFQTAGTLTIPNAPGGFAGANKLANVGASPLYFNGGSRTFLGTPATAGQFGAVLDLGGQNAVVAGGLLVNNGLVYDSANGGTATLIADFGALIKGAGTYGVPVVTVNGGRFQAGNSPGRAEFGSFTFGPGGVDNYVLAINDATGTAGPSPDTAGHVSGWGLVRAVGQVGPTTTSGDFAWTADPAHKLTVAIDTLVNPTTAGADVPGPMDHFDPTQSYVWPAVTWAGSYAGPADAAALDAATAFDATGFLNPTAGGSFGWALDAGGHTLSLTFTPVPEPGTLALLAAATAGWCGRRRSRRQPVDGGGRS